MSLLFWLLWCCNLLLAIFSILGFLFRSNLNLSNPFTSSHFWALILGLGGVVGGLVLRYSLKMPRGSMLLVTLSILILLLFYFFEKD